MQAIREAAGPWSETGMAASVAHGALRGTFRIATCEALVSSLTAAREALAVLGGFLTVLDAPAQVRAKVDVWGPAPDGLTVMRRLKREFDAKGFSTPDGSSAGSNATLKLKTDNRQFKLSVVRCRFFIGIMRLR
jgi:hypothetical protein